MRIHDKRKVSLTGDFFSLMKLLILLLFPLIGYSQLGETKDNIILNIPCYAFPEGYQLDTAQDCVIQSYPKNIVIYNLKNDTCTNITIISDIGEKLYDYFLFRIDCCAPISECGIRFNREFTVYSISCSIR